jgi:hypothetical protein
MMKLETFIETRMRQSENKAMMIRKYIEHPDAFRSGKNSFTEQDAIDSHDDFIKCRTVFRFLKELKKARPETKSITIQIIGCQPCFGLGIKKN